MSTQKPNLDIPNPRHELRGWSGKQKKIQRAADLVYNQGLEQQEAAEIMGISPATVSTYLNLFKRSNQ